MLWERKSRSAVVQKQRFFYHNFTLLRNFYIFSINSSDLLKKNIPFLSYSRKYYIVKQSICMKIYGNIWATMKIFLSKVDTLAKRRFYFGFWFRAINLFIYFMNCVVLLLCCEVAIEWTYNAAQYLVKTINANQFSGGFVIHEC